MLFFSSFFEVMPKSVVMPKPNFDRTWLMLALLTLVLISGAAQAAESSPTLSLQQVISKTMQHNPALLALGYAFDAQAGRVQQAGLKSNPELSLAVEDALGSGQFQGMDSAETTLGISWILEGELRGERVQAEQAQTSVLETERDIQRLDAAASSARLYMLVLSLQARLQQAEQSVALARDVVKTLQQRADKTPAAEVARAKVELSRRLLELEDVEHELLVAKRQLVAQWGAMQVEFVRLDGALDQLPKVATYADLKNRLEQHPRLQSFATRERLAASQLALLNAQNKPQWRLSAGVKHLSESDDQALVASVAVPLTLFDRQQGRIKVAQANMAMNRAERDAQQMQMEVALYAAHQELLHSLHIANAYRQDILPALKTALTETRRAYDVGRYSYLEWQAVQREYLDAQSALMETSLAAQWQAIEIERLTGISIAPAATFSK